MNRTSGQKINKKIGPAQTVNQLDLINTYRALHPMTAEFTFFSSTFGMFAQIPVILDHKLTVHKFKKIKNI